MFSLPFSPEWVPETSIDPGFGDEGTFNVIDRGSGLADGLAEALAEGVGVGVAAATTWKTAVAFEAE